MATQKIAQWAASLTHSSLPPNVRSAATRSFYNWMGCTIGGSNHSTVTKAYKTLEPFFGPPQAHILGHHGSKKADIQHAALINGIASHVHDYDDTHLETIIHPTGPVASAALAYAEFRGNVSGQEFLTALTAGIEAECKIGLAVWPEHYDIGWHITSTVGSIGAAIAVGKLIGLSVQQMQHAIGLASVQVTGLREMFGSDTKSFHPGRAAQNGLLAAVLAQSDYTSSEKPLEAKRGWANCVSSRNDLDRLVDSLGSNVWEIEKNAFKPFPCGIVCHPAIDACIQLRTDLIRDGIDVSKLGGVLDSVQLKVHHLVIELTSKREPNDGLEGKFSVYHGCAVGLLFGKAGPAEYTDAVVNDSLVRQIRDKIVAEADQNIQPDECKVTLITNHAKSFDEHVEHAVGSLQVPMSKQQLEQKFFDQCVPVVGEPTARDINTICWNLENVQNIEDICTKC